MSRSALEKSAIRKMQILQQHQQVVQQPVPPAAYSMGYGIPGGYPMAPPGGVPNVLPGMSGQGYVPIRLTGDEDDNEDQPGQKSNAVPMHGNLSTFNMNNLLHTNIMESEYFRALYQLKTYHEVIDEIYRSVSHVEAWQAGTSRLPSTAFCLLLKFMLMKLTFKQLKGVLDTDDCPLLRAIGFLYLRYSCPPKDLWKWYEPYLEDEEEFAPSADPNLTMTIGSYCIKLFTDMQYFGTTLPRIPVPIERRIKVMLLLLEEKKKRRRSNRRAQSSDAFSAGAKVRAIYGDEENEPAWYEAVIDSVDEDNPDKYWVTFPEYGNSECVDLGDMELPAESKEKEKEKERDTEKKDRDYSGRSSDRDRRGAGGGSRSRSRGGRDYRDTGTRDRDRDRDTGRDAGRDRRRDSRSRSRDTRGDRDRIRERSSRSRDRGGGRGRDNRSRSRSRSAPRAGSEPKVENLMEKVLASQREASAAVGRNYGHRPVSYKGSLALKVDRFTVRKKSRSRSPDRTSGGGGGGGGGRDRRRGRSRSYSRGRDGGKNDHHDASSAYTSSSARNNEASREQMERMKKLKERYGDASAR